MTQKLISLKICIMLLMTVFPLPGMALEESGEIYEITAVSKQAVSAQRCLSRDKIKMPKTAAVRKAALKITGSKAAAVEEAFLPTQVYLIHSRFYFSDYLDD